MGQVEISAPLSVLDLSGKPANFGWARSPLFTYDSTLIRGPARRITESDRYIIFSPTHLITFEALDGGYLGSVSVSVVSLRDKQRSSQSFVYPFPMGSFNMPPGSGEGSVKLQQKRFSLDFTAMEGGSRIIKVDIPKFVHRRHLRGAVVLFPPEKSDSIVTHMAWRERNRAFRLSRRSPWYSVEGIMQFGTTEMVFTKGNAWGILDWNRGSRPSSDVRYWAAGCGLSEGRRIGFSAGYGSADSSQGTENAFFLDGAIHKLDQVTFHISPSGWAHPWRFTSNDNRLEMSFIPSQERLERNRLFLHSMTRNQVYGSFSGKVILDDGSPLSFEDITGIAERRKTRF